MEQQTLIIIFSITFIIPILLETYKLRRSNSSNQSKFYWYKIFNSSFDIILASIGFIYALVERNTKYQGLYWIILVILLCGLIIETLKEGNVRALLNIVIIIITISIPAFYLFIKERPQVKESYGILDPKDIELLNQNDSSLIDLRKMCANYLSFKQDFNEKDFVSGLKKCSNVEEKNLFMACFLLKRENYETAEDYLENIKSEKYQTDKTYIQCLIHNYDVQKISDLFKESNISWLGINTEKLSYAKTQIANAVYKSKKILILDASAGRKGRSTKVAESLKNRLVEYLNITIEPFDYKMVDKKTKLYSKGYYVPNNENGLEKLILFLKKCKITKFDQNGVYVSEKAKINGQMFYDIVIVVN